MTGTTLVTGAGGYLGGAIVAALLETTDDRLLCTVRDADQQRRLGRVAGPRASVAVADLARDAPFDGIDARPVTRIVHAAAVTRFTVEHDLARRVNVDGTARVCEFAHRCPRLQRLAVLSTLYTAGRRTGHIAEVPHGETGFVNEYEWSKWAAEHHAMETCADLPLSILRLPTVIADDATGRVSQYNAFHNTMKLFFYGLLPLVPGSPDTPAAVATAAFTAAATVRLLDPAVPGGIYHVCADPARSATWGALLDAAFAVYGSDPGFRRRRVLKPRYCDADTFDTMVAATRQLAGGPIGQGLASVAPFGPQLYLPKVFANDRLRAAWPGYAAEDAVALVERVSATLLATRWGRHTDERTAA